LAVFVDFRLGAVVLLDLSPLAPVVFLLLLNKHAQVNHVIADNL